MARGYRDKVKDPFQLRKNAYRVLLRVGVMEQWSSFLQFQTLIQRSPTCSPADSAASTRTARTHDLTRILQKEFDVTTL